MEKLRAYARSLPLSFESWLMTFAGIVMIRLLLEQFSGFLPNNFLLIDFSTTVHAFTFFLATVLALMVILLFLAKTQWRELVGISIIGILLIWVAPIVDLATGGLGGRAMAYLFVPGQELLIRFLTFFGNNLKYGATLGIRVEIIIGMIFCSLYTYSATKNKVRTTLAALAFYTLIFFMGSLPSLIALLLREGSDPTGAITRAITSSRIIPSALHPNFSTNVQGLLNFGFNKLMNGIFTVMIAVFSLLFFYRTHKEKFIAVIKNIRPERILYYVLLMILGGSLSSAPWSWAFGDVVGYVATLIAFVSAVIFSIYQNDIYDLEIDNVSNRTRPLITGKLSLEDASFISKISLCMAMLASYAAGSYVLAFTALFIFIYFIYSNPPLRLKRVPILSSALISLACLSMILQGFFIINTDKNISEFPFALAVLFFIFHTLVTNVRDIKDLEGDHAAGIKTLPVILGLKKSKQLIGGTMALFSVIIPLYLHLYFLIIPSIVAGSLCWYFVTQDDYREWKGFVVYIIYLIILICALNITK